MRDVIAGIVAVQSLATPDLPEGVAYLPPDLPRQIATEWTCADAASVAEVGLPAERAALRAYIRDSWQEGAARHAALAPMLRQIDETALMRQTVAGCDALPARTGFGRVVAAMIKATARETSGGRD